VIAEQRTLEHTPIRAARAPQRGFQAERLLVVDPLTLRFGDYQIAELPRLLAPGDALVVNDAATLPASLRVDAQLELRLVSAEGDGTFRAVALGAGDFRQPTEARGTPRRLHAGETLTFGTELAATIVDIRRAEVALFADAKPEDVAAAVRWRY
jgi:S-adenosylmethionine:tRNA ribosyltransferase-isomerase